MLSDGVKDDRDFVMASGKKKLTLKQGIED